MTCIPPAVPLHLRGDFTHSRITECYPGTAPGSTARTAAVMGQIRVGSNEDAVNWHMLEAFEFTQIQPVYESKLVDRQAGRSEFEFSIHIFCPKKLLDNAKLDYSPSDEDQYNPERTPNHRSILMEVIGSTGLSIDRLAFIDRQSLVYLAETWEGLTSKLWTGDIAIGRRIRGTACDDATARNCKRQVDWRVNMGFEK
ncbi:hypothetical protein B0H17DRAFT_1134081 [Mycena rosella]|uniref:Uncharacterized protein n=1 Tax=Mycena rosella TaxID=1033263 RepID=A0AAD7DGF4_MYCRO|nr:hypothetical protein B0H17DRAFT_1134081 [Mycena rosella]